MNMQETFPTIAAAALEYAARGWHVFPARIKDGSKRSYVAGKAKGGARWGATTDPDTIRGYWQQFPAALLGIATGPDSGFFAIDADTPEGHDKDGVGTLRGWIEEHGDLPHTIEATTPSGGWHVYFRWPDDLDIRNSESKLAEGIDVRGDGGMVLAPPTYRADKEAAYRWKNPPGFFDLGDCPEWLLDKIRAAQSPKLSKRAMPPMPGQTPANLAEVEELLGHVDPDAGGYGQWCDVLMALHDHTGGSGDGLALADQWSARGKKYKPGEVRSKWQGFTPGGGVTIGTVAALARKGGADLSAIARKHKTPDRGGQTSGGSMNDDSTQDTDPVDLWGSFDPPELPQGLLPPIIEDFSRANAAQMGADPAGLAMAALATCAAAIPDAVQIKVKRHDEWTESARLWVALMGPPSAKKSPIISAATGPLCRLDVDMMRAWQQRVAEYDALSADEKKGQQRPKQTRLRIEDATVEAAQQVLEGSPWGVLLLQDELSGFFGAMDKYNGGKAAQADRAFWLRSFNGGQFALNRVGRGAAIIDNLSISMLGGIQPEPLRKIAGDAVDDGLLQRLFPITLRTATMGRDEPMPPVNTAYRALIEDLRNLTPPGFMGAGVLEFDNSAQAIRRDLEARHLDLQSLETINRKLASHIGKYDGMFARLCVVWHCIEHAGQDMPATVTESTAQRVADFLHRFLLAHAIAFYSGVLGLSDDHDRLTAIAGYILTHELVRITNRDVQRGDRTMRGLKEQEIRPLLEQLAALGWLDRIDPPRPSSPPHWQVNPAVHAKFADRAKRETERRNKARKTIRDLVRADP